MPRMAATGLTSNKGRAGGRKGKQRLTRSAHALRAEWIASCVGKMAAGTRGRHFVIQTNQLQET